MPAFGITLAALAIEAAVGYPAWLHRRVPHPVVWVGSALGGLERIWNRPASSPVLRRILGVATVILVVGGSAAIGWVIERLLAPWSLGWLLVALVASVGLAQKSLYQHVAAIADALRANDLPAARAAVGRIVGRDTASLDGSGVAAAVLESLGESFGDGIVAPVFWLAVAGLPGLFAYKAANTADSMIGHREERWRAFGWAAARLDDVLNFIPARLAGGLIALAGWRGWGVMLRDAAKHASPNAGWPEAAMAGALGVRLGGPAFYDGVETMRPQFGDGRAPEPADLAGGLRTYLRACALLWGLVAVGVIAWPR